MAVNSIGVAALLAEAAFAQVGDCEEPAARYTVTYEGERLFGVNATFAIPRSRLILQHYPSDARPRGQSASIRNLTAVAKDGGPTGGAYEADGVWRFEAPAASISYTLVADHDEVEWTYGADEVAHPLGEGFYFTGHAMFLAPEEEAPDCPVSVEFSLPEGWTLTSPWPGEGAARRPDSFDSLRFNGFAVGPFAPSLQRVGDFTVTSIFEDRLEDAVRPHIEDVLEALLPAYVRYFGGQPAADYATFHFTYPTSDGSAFRHSFTLQYAWPLNLTERPAWDRVLAHETMHLWIGAGGITGEDHQLDWFTEGFTDYLAVKHLYNAGFLDDEGLRREIGGMVSRYQLGRRLSAGVPLREAGLEKGRHWFRIYGSGSTLALVLDAEMSRREAGAFDRMMRAIFAGGAEPYAFERLMAVMDAHGDGLASARFSAIDDGLSWNEINALTAPSGLSLAGYVETTIVEFSGPCKRRRRTCAPAFLKLAD